VAGTTSDAGKSIVTTVRYRALARRGLSVAPYKAQNMSNNSMVCRSPDGAGAEIGRAQWIQALAAQVAPEPAMNPVLLKPGSDQRSHVVVMGQPAGEVSSRDFVDGRRHLARAAFDAFDDLTERFDVAAMFGTVALLSPEDQRLVAGFVVNKFRGDQSLLEPGLAEIERLTGRVYGVLPWHPDLGLDSEDALDLEGRRSTSGGAALRVAVIRLPRISNFTDVALLREAAGHLGRDWVASGVSFVDARERRLELLADLVEEHLDVEALLDLAQVGAPSDLPVLPPGVTR
jgi:adenosylcobyric acid synthase